MSAYCPLMSVDHNEPVFGLIAALDQQRADLIRVFNYRLFSFDPRQFALAARGNYRSLAVHSGTLGGCHGEGSERPGRGSRRAVGRGILHRTGAVPTVCNWTPSSCYSFRVARHCSGPPSEVSAANRTRPRHWRSTRMSAKPCDCLVMLCARCEFRRRIGHPFRERLWRP